MYKSLKEALQDLEQSGQLLRIKYEVDPNLEMAEIHRRVFDAQGPALLFEKVKGSPFQACSNLYGTLERTDFLFRKTMDKVKRVTKYKADPARALRHPIDAMKAGFTALKGLPSKSFGSANFEKTSIDQLPLIKCWPMDGGAFVTCPQVATLPPGSKKIMESNIGMYRIQLTGNDYITNQEIGLHYQLHRGIGVHHTLYNNSEEEFKCSIFIGGPPSHTFAAIMPMPEGLSELTFAGMLNGNRFKYSFDEDGFLLSNHADFVITGVIKKNFKKPEGPFGDHLGYYSLTHDFPVMEVKNVYHKKDAIWQFTVVGRPPQEDSSFGYLIHELVEELTPGEFPGLVEINAVDAAGVHPLLLAIGKERYMPFRDKKPEEILTIANRILGSGQTSLAKFLIIAAKDETLPDLNCHDIDTFFTHVLERIDWKRDLHFQTKTTIDTLDYSGDGWNAGSKVVMACCGEKLRSLSSNLPNNLKDIPSIKNIHLAQPGILAIELNPFTDYAAAAEEVNKFAEALESKNLEGYPLIVIVDDSLFMAETLNNFLWVSFTRANPSHDIYGVNASTQFKHWGCTGPLIIDARIKPHHAPGLEVPEEIIKRVDMLVSQDIELKQILSS